LPLLEVDDLRTGYGQLPVLHGMTFAVEEGQTAVILGLNGAGKTTTLITVAGLLKAWSGRIAFAGRDIARMEAEERVEAGIVLVPEGRRVFPALTVANNLRLGAWTKRSNRAEIEHNLDRVFGYFPRIAERHEQMAGTMSGGEQQMLAVARGLMSNPKLLLVDEASLGLAPKMTALLFDTMRRINQDGTTVLMVEQNAGVLPLADHALVIEKGSIVQSGTGPELAAAGELRKAYLGTA
jgi:branched-chain amino acid transport system ATP-binding protein